jgi:Bacterial transglutaminase-like N-terminal region
MNRYRLVHVTEFRYDGPVSESYNTVRLHPCDDEFQSCLSFKLQTERDACPVDRSRCDWNGSGRMSGLRSSDVGSREDARHSRTLRVRLPGVCLRGR